jgi:hypothetical protein
MACPHKSPLEAELHARTSVQFIVQHVREQVLVDVLQKLRLYAQKKPLLIHTFSVFRFDEKLGMHILQFMMLTNTAKRPTFDIDCQAEVCRILDRAVGTDAWRGRWNSGPPKTVEFERVVHMYMKKKC